jgi:hypothetical protein
VIWLLPNPFFGFGFGFGTMSNGLASSKMNTFKDKVAYRFAKTGFSVSKILIFLVEGKSIFLCRKLSMGSRGFRVSSKMNTFIDKVVWG